jgi:hypothetical protein
MNPKFAGCLLVAALVLALGCAPSSRPTAEPQTGHGAEPALAPRPAKDEKPTRVEVGKNVFFEKAGEHRRVIVEAYVCLREGQLEQLLTRKQAKEHESILAADVDARHIHAALLLTGAKAGSPVRFEPKYQPATGSKIKVTLQYDDNGKKVAVPAQHWVRASRTKKDLSYHWVFAGSQLIPNPLDPKKPDYFLANDGDIICVANFQSALLDLPVQSSAENDDLLFEAHTERIPPKDTKVGIVLEPIADSN